MLDKPVVHGRRLDGRDAPGQPLDVPEKEQNHAPHRQQRDWGHISLATAFEVIVQQPVGVDNQHTRGLDHGMFDLEHAMQQVVTHPLPGH